MTHATTSLPSTNTSHTLPGGPSAIAPAPAAPSTQSAILATENFITFLDALRLGINSKDQLHPLLSEVIQSANKVTDADFEGRANIIKWLIRLNGMKAHEELSDGDRREVEFEIDAAYRGFKAIMS
jgi:ESCRT-I complex subunit VPS28